MSQIIASANPLAAMPSGMPRKTITAEECQRVILSLRAEWKIEEPELHVLPIWLRSRVTAAIKAGKLPISQIGVLNSYYAMWHAIVHLGDGWADHFGRIVRPNGVQELISEPYGITETGCRELDRFCECLGLRYRIEPRSWWFPSSTIRIVIGEETL